MSKRTFTRTVHIGGPPEYIVSEINDQEAQGWAVRQIVTSSPLRVQAKEMLDTLPGNPWVMDAIVVYGFTRKTLKKKARPRYRTKRPKNGEVEVARHAVGCAALSGEECSCV